MRAAYGEVDFCDSVHALLRVVNGSAAVQRTSYLEGDWQEGLCLDRLQSPWAGIQLTDEPIQADLIVSINVLYKMVLDLRKRVEQLEELE